MGTSEMFRLPPKESSAPLSDTTGNPVFRMLTMVAKPLSAPFGASAYNGPLQVAKTSASDATGYWAIHNLHEHVLAIFDTPLPHV